MNELQPIRARAEGVAFEVLRVRRTRVKESAPGVQHGYHVGHILGDETELLFAGQQRVTRTDEIPVPDVCKRSDPRCVDEDADDTSCGDDRPGIRFEVVTRHCSPGAGSGAEEGKTA